MSKFNSPTVDESTIRRLYDEWVSACTSAEESKRLEAAAKTALVQAVGPYFQNDYVLVNETIRSTISYARVVKENLPDIDLRPYTKLSDPITTVRDLIRSPLKKRV